MKYSLPLVIVILFGISGCSSQKKLVSDAPFRIENPSCTPYSGGMEESGSGFVLRMGVSINAGEDVDFETVYFRGHTLDPEVIIEEGKQYLQCRYVHKKQSKPDIVMHADTRKEVGNQPPAEKVGLKEFPFELKPDEAVIEYRYKGKTRYTKIGGIKDKMPDLLPAIQKN